MQSTRMTLEGAFRTLTIATVVLLLLLAAQAAAAQDGQSDCWRFKLGPYLWISKLEGDRTVPPVAAPVRFSGGTSFGAPTVAGAYVEAGKGRWSVSLNIVRVRTREEIDLGDGDQASARTGVTFNMSTWELLGSRRLGTAGNLSWLELFAGLRYTSLAQRLHGLAGALDLDGRREDNWMDPILGGYLLMNPHTTFGFLTRWEIGGFGIGADFTWGVSTGFVFRWTRSIELLVEYKLADVDYQSGEVGTPGFFLYNGTVHGMLARVAFNL